MVILPHASLKKPSRVEVLFFLYDYDDKQTYYGAKQKK